MDKKARLLGSICAKLVDITLDKLDEEDIAVNHFIVLAGSRDHNAMVTVPGITAERIAHFIGDEDLGEEDAIRLITLSALAQHYLAGVEQAGMTLAQAKDALDLAAGVDPVRRRRTTGRRVTARPRRH